MTTHYAVRYTRTTDSDPITVLDHARFTDADEAAFYALSIAGMGHILAADAVEVTR